MKIIYTNKGKLGKTLIIDNIYNLTKGQYIFGFNKDIKEAKSDFNNMVGGSVDLSNLTSAIGLFYNCDELLKWDVPLPNLSTGNYMFMECDKLNSFTVNLPILVNGNYMFNNCKSLSTWTIDLPEIKNA